MWSLCLTPGGHGSSLHWWSQGSRGVWPAAHTPIANMCSCLHGRVLHPTHPASRHPASPCYFPTTQPASTISLSPPSSSQTSGTWTRLFAARKEVPGFSAGGFSGPVCTMASWAAPLFCLRRLFAKSRASTVQDTQKALEVDCPPS